MIACDMEVSSLSPPGGEYLASIVVNISAALTASGVSNVGVRSAGGLAKKLPP
jgi:hypothetical protein